MIDVPLVASASEAISKGQGTLRSLGTSVRLNPGFVLCRQGDPSRHVFVVVSGTVILTTDGPERECVIGLRSEGSIIGSAAAILERFHPFTAVCVSRCVAWTIPGRQLTAGMREDGDLATYVAHINSIELHRHIAERTRLLSRTAATIFEELIWRLSEDRSSATVRLPISQAAVARWLGVSPQYLTTIISRLEKQKIIQRSKSGLIVLDRARLCATAAA
jgi:CRP-like cAMP-binding protein